MKIRNVFKSFSATPFWGYIDIRCGNIESNNLSEFELYDILKKEKFTVGWNDYYANETAKLYSQSIFGNFIAESVTLTSFKKIEIEVFLQKFTSFIVDNKRNHSNSWFDFDFYLQSQLNLVKTVFNSNDLIFEFEENSFLKPIMPDGIGGPHDFFTCFIAFGEDAIGGVARKTIKIIRMGMD